MALAGGFWFFLFVVLVLGFGIVSAELDNVYGGIITLVFLTVGAQTILGIPVFQAIVANPLLIIVGIILYIVAGFVYGIMFRYSDFLNKNSDRITEKWETFVKEHKGPGEPSRDDFRNSYEYRTYSPSANADRITAWVMLWPWGVFWDLCHKPIRWVYNNTYTFAGKLLDKVSARVSDRILDKVK